MLSPLIASTAGSRGEVRASRTAFQNLKSNELKTNRHRVLRPLLTHHRLHRPIIKAWHGYYAKRGSPAVSQGFANEKAKSSIDEPDISKAKRRLSNWSMSLKNNIVAPLSPSIRNVVASYSSASKHLTIMRKEVKQFRDLDADTRQKLAFVFSSLIGTGMLCTLFKLLTAMLTSTRFFVRPLSLSKSFAISYYIAYLFSVLWQHILNRWFVFESGEESFLDSLFSTYVVYGFSMLVSSLISMTLISLVKVDPNSAFLLTLPVNGVSNFYLLRRFSGQSQQSQINSVITVV